MVLFNLSDQDFKITKGDRIAQLICERIYYPEVEEVEVGRIHIVAKKILKVLFLGFG